MTEKQQQTEAKAAVIWKAMTASERHGVRFGMFPSEQITAAKKEGFDGHLLCIALMDCATKDGGMIG